MSIEIEGLVAFGNKSIGEITHKDRCPPTIAANARCDTDDAMLDPFRDRVHETRRPHLGRVSTDIAVEPHGRPAGVGSAARLLSDPTFHAATQRGSNEIALMPSAREVAERLHFDYA